MIKPGSFDPITAREIICGESARDIEAKARINADAGNYAPPERESTGTYWSQVCSEMRQRVYFSQFNKRKARNERKAAGVRTA